MATTSTSQPTSPTKPDNQLDPKTTDPVILDLLAWLRENLPDVPDEDLFNHAPITPDSEEIINSQLEELKEYLALNEEKQLKTKKLDASTARLDLKKEQYKLVASIKLDGCLDLISRYNHLMAKK